MDFQIDLPDIKIKKNFEDKKLLDFKGMDFDLIREKISPHLLSNILHGCFWKEKILVIIDNDILKKNIKNFFSFIFQDTFIIDLTIRLKDDYLRNKKKYENHLIFTDNKIIRDKKKIFEKKEKNSNIERKIVHNFYVEPDTKFGLIILRNEICKAHILSKTIIDFINSFKGEELHKKLILDHLKHIYNVKIQLPYLNFLLDVVMNYFDITVPITSDLSNFLKFL